MRYQEKKSFRKKLIGILSGVLVLMIAISGFSAFASNIQSKSASEVADKIAASQVAVTEKNEEAVATEEIADETEYWQLLLGGKPVALMTTESSARDVIKYIKEKYSEKDATSVTLDPEITVEKVVYSADESVPEVSKDSTEVAEKLLKGNTKTTTYEVQEGDTLWGIAYDNDTDVDTILDTNPQIDPEIIREGDKINFVEGEPDVKVVVESTIQEVQDVDYEVVYEETDELYAGEEEVVVEGVKGTKKVTLNVTKVNGAVESSETIDEVVETEPVAMVVKVGTAPLEDYSEDTYSEDTYSEDTYSDEETYSEEESYIEEPYTEESQGGGGEVQEESSSSSSIRQTIVDAAMAQLGIDQSCTQLVSSALEAGGISCWTGPSGFTSLGSWTDNPEPGDICIYTSHVALYIGNGQAVHGGWVGDGPRTTAVWGVHLSWPTFLGYIHLDI